MNNTPAMLPFFIHWGNVTDSKLIECAKIAFPNHTDYLLNEGRVQCVHEDKTLGAVCDTFDLGNKNHLLALVRNIQEPNLQNLLKELSETYKDLSPSVNTKKLIEDAIADLDNLDLRALDCLSYLPFVIATVDENKKLSLTEYPFQGAEKLYDLLSSIRALYSKILMELSELGFEFQSNAFRNSLGSSLNLPTPKPLEAVYE